MSSAEPDQDVTPGLGAALAATPETGRGRLGRLVRETWVAWAREQPDPKPSWLTPWEELDAGQREVGMRIGEAVSTEARADERARIRSLLPYNVNCCEGFPAAVADMIGEHGDG